jgi:hypothetical protein
MTGVPDRQNEDQFVLSLMASTLREGRGNCARLYRVFVSTWICGHVRAIALSLQ